MDLIKTDEIYSCKLKFVPSAEKEMWMLSELKIVLKSVVLLLHRNPEI